MMPAAYLLANLLIFGNEEIQVKVLTFLIDAMKDRWLNVLCADPEASEVLLKTILSSPIGDFSLQMINRMITEMETLSKPDGDEYRAKIIRDIIYGLKDKLPGCAVLQNAIRRYERRQTPLILEGVAKDDANSNTPPRISLPTDLIKHIGGYL